MKEGESFAVLIVWVVVCTWLGPRHFKSIMVRESTTEWRVHLKKKFKGFPMFLHSKFFETALMGDIKQWSSRRHYRRHLYRRRHRCSGSKVERKMKM
jgi:hypothetical protein